MAVTPDSDSLDAPDRLARPSGLSIAVGVCGVLLAGAAVATAGFLAGGGVTVPSGSDAVGIDTQSSQLGTLPLHDEKPMKGIGKGVATSTP